MKTTLALLFSLAFFSGQAFAQTDSLQLRSAIGSSLQFSVYRWNSHTELVNDNERIVLDGGLQYILFLGDNWYLQTGVEQTKRRNIRPINDVETHVAEEFAQIPLMVGYGTALKGNGTVAKRLNVAGGGYAAQLYRQGIAPVGSTRIHMAKRENDYWKFGLTAEASVMLVPKNKQRTVMHQFGMRGFIDIKGANIINDRTTRVFDNYTGGSLFYTLYLARLRRS